MENLLYNLKSFPITISITYVFTLYLISFMFFVNMLDFYSSSHLALFNREIGSFLRLDTFISSSVTVIICALNIVMSLVVALSIYFTGNNTSGVLYFFEQISKNIFPLSRLCVDILFVLGGFTLLTGLPIAIVTFVINSLLTLVTAAVHHNYVMRKDFMCCKSF